MEKKNDSYDDFDWEKYTSFYEDLKYIKCKKDAVNHWLNHGKKENRIRFLKQDEYTEIESVFDWEKYKETYQDLKNIHCKKDALEHWLKYGEKENRLFFKIDSVLDKNQNEKETDLDNFRKEYDNFNWKIYIENYPDLKEIKSEKKAWAHWVIHGKKEKRVLFSLHDREMENYLKLKEKEQEIKSNEKKDIPININNDLVLKPFYTNYGQHYFGWEKVMNHFLDYIQKNIELKQFKFKEKIFLDEWLEKLLIWGNKIKNKEFIHEIEENNYKWISFLHSPPYKKYFNLEKEEKEEIENQVIFNEKLLNKNVFELLNSTYPKIKENIKYLYTLSNSHKKYIYENFPEYRSKLVSVYHPIDLNTEINKSFNFNEFKESKNIFHIGWWLRNFKTYIDICFPCGFQKNILVKKDFEREWNFILCNFDLTNIQVVKDLNNTEYEEIFRNACIFCDIEDAVANNVVLECIKFNTPIIVKKIDSVVEYLGEDYPLYFSNKEDLNRIEFSTNNEFLTMILKAHEYLLNWKKTHVQLSTFNKKIMYDLQKLSFVENQQYRLTWFCFIENENHLKYIQPFMEQFENQHLLENILLEFIIHEKVLLNEEIMEIISFYKEKYPNIKIIFIKDENTPYHDCLNICIQNATTDYLTIVHIHDSFSIDFSSKHIEYLDSNPNCDITFSSFSINNFNNENEENIFYEKDKQIFIDEFDDKNLSTNNFVWRKKMHSIVYYFESLDNKYELEALFYVFLKKCLQSHLNICCVSNEILCCLLQNI
jgi:hypothetical protein